MDEEKTLKLYFIPYLAAGHMIPLSDIATLFASRGQHVTIITTPSNAQILRKSISDAVIHLHTVQFPSKQVGLPDGVETMTALTNLADSAKFYQAAMLLQGPIGDFVEQNPPDCIVADFMMPWVGDLANRLRIPRLAFNGFSLFTDSMDGGDEAEQIRRRAQEYGRKARLAVEEGGSSHKNLTALIDDIKRLRA